MAHFTTVASSTAMINCLFRLGLMPRPEGVPVTLQPMMTSSNGNIFCATSHLCGGLMVTGAFPPHKGLWRRALVIYFVCAWINGWVNDGETGDLRRHRAHYDIIVMHKTNVQSSHLSILFEQQRIITKAYINACSFNKGIQYYIKFGSKGANECINFIR